MIRKYLINISNKKRFLLILLVTVALISGIYLKTKKISFNYDIWINSKKDKNTSIRYRMSDDLLEKLKKEKRFNVIDIIALLGKPDISNADVKNANELNDLYLRYELGRKYFIFIPLSQYYLLLKFNKKGNLAYSSIHPE